MKINEVVTENVGTFMGDIAKTIGSATSGSSYFTRASSPETINTEIGQFHKTPQGWATETNKLVTDPNIIAKLDALDTGNTPQSTQPAVNINKIQPVPKAGAPTPAEQAKFQQQLQAAMKAQA